MNIAESLGGAIIRFTNQLGSIILFVWTALRQMVVPPADVRNIFKQMMEIGVRSLPVVLITAVFTGMVFALQTYTGFKRFGAESLVGSVVAPSS